MTVRLLAVFSTLVHASMVAPLSAQQDTTAVDPEQVTVPGSMYDKPYLTTLAGRTAIGGYAEGHARFGRVDGVTEELGFEAKRFNLFTATRVSDYVRIGAEIEFEEGGEEIKLEYAAIDVMFSTRLGLRAGMILSPLGRFNLSHDSPRNEFTDRPLVSTDLTGVALSEAGLGIFGTLPLRGGPRVTYEAYATNGFHDGLITASPEGTRIPLGRGNTEDENASPAFVARTALSPRVGYELGLSVHHGGLQRLRRGRARGRRAPRSDDLGGGRGIRPVGSSPQRRVGPRVHRRDSGPHRRVRRSPVGFLLGGGEGLRIWLGTQHASIVFLRRRALGSRGLRHGCRGRRRESIVTGPELPPDQRDCPEARLSSRVERRRVQQQSAPRGCVVFSSHVFLTGENERIPAPGPSAGIPVTSSDLRTARCARA